jgi:hypothetical protein
MDNDVQQKLADWLAGRLKVGSDVLPGISALSSREKHFIDVHVSDLFPRTKQSKLLLDRSYDAFASLTRQLGRNAEHLMAVLTLPLRESEEPGLPPPGPDQIGDELSATPPTIYLVNRDWFRFMNPQEIHRAPLRWPPIHEQTSEAIVTYRVSRSLTGVVNKWEFDRAIEIEHYPPSLIPANLWQDWLAFIHADRQDVERIAQEWREGLQRSLFLPKRNSADAGWPYDIAAAKGQPHKRRVKARK